MAITTFTAAQILTAAQMNAVQSNDYNQTVSTKTASYTLVAADKGTKIVMNSASATTITVNTSLFSAGDTLTILNIAAGVCTVTAGTATVSTTGSLALAQNGGGTLYFTSAGVSVFQANGVTASPSGLVCVLAETAFSAVSSVTADNVFSTTYTNYLVVVRASGSTDEGLYIQMRVGGVTTTSNYNYQVDEVVNTTGSASRSASQSLMRIGTVSTSNSLATSNVYSPFVATQTSFINDNNVNSTYTTPRYIIVRGNQSGATSFDGLIITAGLATITGTLTVYGYAKAV